MLVSSFPCKTIIHHKIQVAWLKRSVSITADCSCLLPVKYLSALCLKSARSCCKFAKKKEKGRCFGVTHMLPKKCPTNQWCVVLCLLSVQTHQGCFQLPWTEPGVVRVCYNGLGPVTSVIMLQHKVIAADKWQHNEPRDHVILPVHLDHHQ